MRNNKILTRQPTHTPRGAFTQPRGAFDSFQGLQVGSNLGLIWGKGLPDSTQTSTHEGLHKGPKQRTRPQSKTQLTSMTTQDSNRPCKAQIDQQFFEITLSVALSLLWFTALLTEGLIIYFGTMLLFLVYISLCCRRFKWYTYMHVLLTIYAGESLKSCRFNSRPNFNMVSDLSAWWELQLATWWTYTDPDSEGLSSIAQPGRVFLK